MILIKKDNAFYINDVKICDTLDPGILTKGIYNLEINYSPKFKKDLPLIYNDEFTANRGFRIHQGNSFNDTNGCILVGIKDKDNHLINSSITLNSLLSIIKFNSIKYLIIL